MQTNFPVQASAEQIRERAIFEDRSCNRISVPSREVTYTLAITKIDRTSFSDRKETRRTGRRLLVYFVFYRSLLSLFIVVLKLHKW